MPESGDRPSKLRTQQETARITHEARNTPVSGGLTSAPHFLVHEHTDNVAVAVQEGISAGQKVMLWVMDTDETLEMTALDAIPLGHKIALKDLAAGDTVIKYAHDVGRIVAPVKRGGHVHTHNMKTKRW
jgi:(2R)-sulfolactate sulfo-lyase subunit alpha